MDRHNWYGGHLVMDTDMNTAFGDAFTAEKNMRLSHGLASAEAAGSPNPTRRGGITVGGVITRVPATSKTIAITELVATDVNGQRIATGGSAQFELTHAGVNDTEGDLTPGGWSGGAIAVPLGTELWASVYAGFAELLSDLKTDPAGLPVYFRVQDSFLFKVVLGASAAPPATDRAALEDGWVLLDDILLENPAGTTQIKNVGGTDAICGSNHELDLVGYGLDDVAALSGRRADWISAEDVTNYPIVRQSGDQVFSLREGSPREAFEHLLGTLTRRVYAAGPPIQAVGSQIVGARAQAGAGLAYAVPAASSLASNTLDAQLLYLLNEINKRTGRGGDTIQPPAGTDGFIFDPTNLDRNRYLVLLKSLLGGAVGSFLGVTRRGALILPTFLWDDFTYPSRGAAGAWDPTTDSHKWGDMPYTNPATYVLQNIAGGVVRSTTPAVAGEGSALTSGWYGVGAGEDMGAWGIGASPWAVAVVRFRLPTALTDRYIEIGFNRTVGDNSHAKLIIDGNAGTMVASVLGAGGLGGATASMGAPAFDTWYTAVLAILANNKLEIQIGLSGTPQEVTLGGGATFSTGSYRFDLLNQSKVAGGGAASILDLDFVFVCDQNVRF